MNDSIFRIIRIKKLDISKLNTVARIIYACGKDMAKKYDLHHWDNPFIKSLVIVVLCNLKNNVFVVHDGINPVATFMTKKIGDDFHFEKLGTLPSESGKGIGSFCMTKIEEMANEAGCKKVVMEVYEPSKHAISFYEHRGYVVVGMINTLKYTEVKMEKRI